MRNFCLKLAVLLSFSACEVAIPGPFDAGLDPGVDAGPDSDSGQPGDAGQIDAGGLDAGPAGNQYTPASANWCERVAPGPAVAEAAPLSLSAAHATVRYFGLLPGGSLPSLARFDEPLISVLQEPTLTLALLDSYAQRLVDVCAVPATKSMNGDATVTLRGSLAWVHPGLGAAPVIPAEATAVVLDLRGLVDSNGLEAALSAATRAVLSSPMPRAGALMRRWNGHPDTYYFALRGLPASADVYSSSVEVVARPIWPGEAKVARPLVVVTGPTLPPVAAELALTLRSTGRAALVGHEVLSRVAESVFQPIGALGASIRVSRLELPDGPVGDVIPADLSSDTPERVLNTLVDVTALPHPALTGLSANRKKPEAIDLKTHRAPKALSPAHLRAALLVAHGTARRFFPIYDVWNPAIDARLLEQYAAVPATLTRRAHMRRAIERFVNALHDGHISVNDLNYDSTSYDDVNVAELDFELVNDVPVVTFSNEAGIAVGDSVTSVDGEPIADWLAREEGFVSAASPLTGRMFAASGLVGLPASGRTYGLESANGTAKTVTIVPTSALPTQAPFGPQRASGWLTDLGAPTLYYLNLNGYAATPETEAQLLARLNAASTATGVILDDRGYPGVQLDTLVGRVVGTTYKSPRYRVPTWRGPDAASFLLDVEQYTSPAASPSVKAPVALLVGPYTQSAAETLAMELLEGKDFKVVGRRTSASNGNITSAVLPGGFGFTFTGMQVRFADDRAFAGVGIVPTVVSALSVADLAQGKDRELLDAVKALTP